MNNAYVAGLLDGEGSVGVYGKRFSDLTISIANTYEPIIEMLCTEYGGEFYKYPIDERAHRKVKSRKPLYKWVLHGQKALSFLHDVYPFLVIKKKRAELIFSLNLQPHSICVKKYKYRIPKEEINRRKKIAMQLRELNKRGYIDID